MLIIMQGVPGSGKSTIARQLASTLPAYICSTDDYFYESGEYKFDQSKLAMYHKMNQDHAEELLMKNLTDNVIIDNTNLKNYEIKPYVKAAINNGHQIIFIRCNGRFDSIHRISPTRIEFMRQQMEELSIEKALSAIAPWELGA